MKAATTTANSTQNDAIVEIDALHRRFRASTVVERFDALLREGDRVALRGPNGSGKTTILRCIGGTLNPTAGFVRVGGFAAGTFEARTLIGPSLSQERSFYRRLSGFENLLFFARLRHVSKRRAFTEVQELEQELELSDILRRRVDRCSAGMVQQLSFARALLGSPRLLLLDEPTRSLDDAAVNRLWAAIDRRPEVALVLASHLEADHDKCDRVYDLPT